ncbi:MAG: winged helix DNA-binding domain-containing protein, partial [Pseudonocardia sp.]|nr:winged helix DNA-binding domain-containing protein [Pseudonocardia sp.]
MTEFSRGQVLAHRYAVHGLDRTVDDPDALAVLDLGVQNSPPGALPVALSARLRQPSGPG